MPDIVKVAGELVEVEKDKGVVITEESCGEGR
jgi:hypothetical protein